MNITQLIEARVSTNYFDASRTVDDACIAELIRLATLSPSAYHFQNWEFIAVRSQDAKTRLFAHAYGQRKILDASVTFIVCGKLNPHVQLALALIPAVQAEVIDTKTMETWVSSAKQKYVDHPHLQRDEAIRSASLATMSLLLAAQGIGLSSCPMGGFDEHGVRDEFGLSSDSVPVMLVTVGYASEGNWQQKPRKPIEEVLSFA